MKFDEWAETMEIKKGIMSGYWLDDEIVCCEWNHKTNPFMISNKINLVDIAGIKIVNDRS